MPHRGARNSKLAKASSLARVMNFVPAQKVFMIPELLENILIYVGTASIPITSHSTTSHVRQLFAMQRINTMFRNTIIISIHLRRIMFLEKRRNEEDEEEMVNPHCRGYPNFNVLYPMSFDYRQMTEDTWFIYIPQARFEEHMWKESRTLDKSSWREMLVTNDSRKIEICGIKRSIKLTSCPTLDNVLAALADVTEDLAYPKEVLKARTVDKVAWDTERELHTL